MRSKKSRPSLKPTLQDRPICRSNILAGMDRRQFFFTRAGLAVSSAAGYPAQPAAGKTRRVGLIGCGWYGKCDLFRLIQVAPVEVVSLCDVDKNMLAEGGDMGASRSGEDTV